MVRRIQLKEVPGDTDEIQKTYDSLLRELRIPVTSC